MDYRLDESMAELVGVIIGDGTLRYTNNQYFVEIVGNPKKEKNYYEFLSQLVNRTVDKTPSVVIRERGIRLKFYSKKALVYFVEDLGMPFGKGKNLKVLIPDKILKNTLLLKACLRGIMDTDGSLYLAKKGKNLNYPCIEITTTSKGLAHQIFKQLRSFGFRVCIREEPRELFANAFRVGIYGNKMIKKWKDEIGFSNSKNLEKYQEFLRNI